MIFKLEVVKLEIDVIVLKIFKFYLGWILSLRNKNVILIPDIKM